MKHIVKLTKCGRTFTLHGCTFPPHLQRAFGRHVFKLLHTTHDSRLWLRDMPLNLADLAYNGFPVALAAYNAECDRAHVTEERGRCFVL